MLSQEQKQSIIDLCEQTSLSVKNNPDIRNHREMVDSMLDYFQNAPYEIKNDKEIMLAAIKVHQYAFAYSSDSLKQDVSFAKAALKANPNVRDYLSPEMQKKVDAPAVKRPPFSAFAAAIEDAKARAAGQTVDNKHDNPNKSR